MLRRSQVERDLKITYKGKGLMMASYAHVCVAVWSVKPTPELFEIQRRELAAAVARNPGQAFFICVVSPTADPPDQELREASSKMVASHVGKMLGCAGVIEGSGFRAAITRTVLTGMLIFTRSPVPYTFCDTIPAACAWIEARSGQKPLTKLPSLLDAARSNQPQRSAS